MNLPDKSPEPEQKLSTTEWLESRFTSAWRKTRNTLNSILPSKKDIAKVEGPKSSFRNPNTKEPMFTGEFTNNLARPAVLDRFSYKQGILALGLIGIFSTSTVKCSRDTLNQRIANTTAYTRNTLEEDIRERCHVDTPFPSPVLHPYAWIQEVRYRLNCRQKDNQDYIDRMVRDNQRNEARAFAGRCDDHSTDIYRERFGHFYADHDVRFWSTPSTASNLTTVVRNFDQIHSTQPWHDRESTGVDHISYYLAQAIHDNGQFALSENPFRPGSEARAPLLRVGQLNRRRAMRVATRFRLDHAANEMLERDAEIRHWYTNLILREGRRQHNQGIVIQKMFALPPFCNSPEAEQNSNQSSPETDPNDNPYITEAHACNDAGYQANLVTSLQNLNYQDRSRIRRELRRLFSADESRLRSCTDDYWPQESTCWELIQSQDSAQANQAARIYIDTLRTWR